MRRVVYRCQVNRSGHSVRVALVLVTPPPLPRPQAAPGQVAPHAHRWGDTNLHGDNDAAEHLPKDTAGGQGQVLGPEQERGTACQGCSARPRPAGRGHAGARRGTGGHDGFASARLQAGRGQLPAGLALGAGDGAQCGERRATLGSFSGGRGGQGGQPAPSHLPAHRRRASRRQRADADSSCFEQPRTQVKQEINSQSQNFSGVLESFEATQAHAGGYVRSAPTELCPDRAVPGGRPFPRPLWGRSQPPQTHPLAMRLRPPQLSPGVPGHQGPSEICSVISWGFDVCSSN